MRIVAWERTDQRRGLSLARREQLDDGWRFHGSEILVGDETLSCTFGVVVGPDWVTRRAEVLSVSSGGEVRRVLEASEGRWTVDGHPRPDLEGCVDVDIAATPLTNTFRSAAWLTSLLVSPSPRRSPGSTSRRWPSPV